MIALIYADNAATTPIDPNALELMIEIQRRFFGNASEPYKFARPLKKILRESRELIAECIGADAEEIVFTSGGTESDNHAIKSVALANLRQSPHLITSAIEHHAVLNSCAAMENLGCEVTRLPVDRQGRIRKESLVDAIQSNTKLISIMLANNEVGSIQPISELAEIAHSNGILFHTDAVQAVGHIPIDVKALNVDMLSASGHKFNAPKGIGFFYIRKGLALQPYMNGGGQEFGRRAGTENVPAIAAMALALKNNCAELETNAKKLHALANSIVRELRDHGVDFIRNGAEDGLPGLLSLSFGNIEGETLLHRLDLRGICVATGSACNADRTEISHVLEAMHVEREYAVGTIRISLGKNNSAWDASEIARAIIEITVD